MEAQMIYPADMQRDVDTAADPRTHAADGERSGKTKGVLSKVKRNARKLKDKIKKVSGSNTTSTDHGDLKRDQVDPLHQNAPGPEDEGVDEGVESYDDDEEEDDHTHPADNQFKYQQLRSIGALDDQGNEKESEVHGGVPVSDLATAHGTYWKSADDNGPISPYKSGGPPDALQATPTEYRNYAADDPLLQSGGDEKATSNTFDDGIIEDKEVRDRNQEPDFVGLPTSAEVDTSRLPVEPSSGLGASGNAPAKSDVDVSYPEDLVKPNPSFGQSSSPIHDKIGVMNEDLSTDGMLGVGRTSEEYSSRGKTDLLDTSVPEFAELSGQPCAVPGPVEADDLVYRPVSDPDEGSSLTSPHGTLDGVVNEKDANAQSYGTGQSLDNSTSAFANETEYPNTDGEVKPSLDTVDGVENSNLISGTADGVNNLPLEQSAREKTAEPEQNLEESWGKWSADKLNSSKDGISTGLTGVDNTSERDGWSNNSVSASLLKVGGGDRAPKGQDVDNVGALSKPRDLVEDVSKDEDIDYFDPNDVEGNQFQEGFALGSGDAEEDDLNSTLAGSAIGKLQGLTGTLASTLGYGSVSSPRAEGAVGEDRPPVEGENINSSPRQQQQPGFVQGLKDSVASTLGYGKELSTDEQSLVANGEHRPEVDSNASQQQTGEGRPPVEGENLNFSPRQQQPGFVQGLKDSVASTLGYGKELPTDEQSLVANGELEADSDASQQQTGGTFQGLKNVVAAKLGYGTSADGLHSPVEKAESRESPVEETTADTQPIYDESGEHGIAINTGSVSRDAGERADREGTSPSQQQTGSVLQGVKNIVASKLGYNGLSEAPPQIAEMGRETDEEVPAGSSAVAEEKAGGDQGNNYAQKLFNTTAAATDYLSSKVGYGNSNQGKGDKNLAYAGEGEKQPISPSTHANNYNAHECTAPSQEDQLSTSSKPSHLW